MAIKDWFKRDVARAVEEVPVVSNYSRSSFGVIGLNNGAGASTITVALAQYLAKQEKKKVLLLDADFLQPSLYYFFDGLKIPAEKSIIRYLDREINIKDINIKVPGYESLWLITASPLDRTEMVLSTDMDYYQDLLKYVVDTFDFVVVRLPYQPAFKTFYSTVNHLDRSFFVWDEQGDCPLKTESVLEYFRNFSHNIGYSSSVLLNKRTKSGYDYQKITDIGCNLLGELPYESALLKAKSQGKYLLDAPGLTTGYLESMNKIITELTT